MTGKTRRVGIDWGSERHQVCRIDRGKEPEQRSFRHTGEDLRRLLDFVTEGVARDEIVVAIETKHGPVVEMLLSEQLALYSINPKVSDRLRDRFSPAGAKDDRRDAFVLASCVESDSHCFRRIENEPEEVVRLRSSVRIRSELREALRMASNRLWTELRDYRPESLRLCSAADEPWFWDLIERAGESPKGQYRRGSEATPHSPVLSSRDSRNPASRHPVLRNGLPRGARLTCANPDQPTQALARATCPSRAIHRDRRRGSSEERRERRAPSRDDPAFLAGSWTTDSGHGARGELWGSSKGRLQRSPRTLRGCSRDQAERQVTGCGHALLLRVAPQNRLAPRRDVGAAKRPKAACDLRERERARPLGRQTGPAHRRSPSRHRRPPHSSE
jgi:hypothetical protein